jgi:hypothetical protein
MFANWRGSDDGARVHRVRGPLMHRSPPALDVPLRPNTVLPSCEVSDREEVMLLPAELQPEMRWKGKMVGQRMSVPCEGSLPVTADSCSSTSSSSFSVESDGVSLSLALDDSSGELEP